MYNCSTRHIFAGNIIHLAIYVFIVKLVINGSTFFTVSWVYVSLVPRPYAVEGLVKLLRRMTSGGRLESWLIAQFTGSAMPPDVILRRSFTRPSTALAVIEGLGTKLLSLM